VPQEVRIRDRVINIKVEVKVFIVNTPKKVGKLECWKKYHFVR
jgi:hypothetical protein